MFSSTEFEKSKFYNVTASTFFSGLFFIKVNDELKHKLFYSNFKYIFDINSNYREYSIEKFEINDKNMFVYKGDLNSIINNGELFKDTIDKNIINNSIFIFHNIKWKDVCKGFLSKNIVISGGSSTKRHILAPIHYKLVSAIQIFDFLYQDIVTSFTKICKEKEISMPKDELSLNGSANLKQINKKSFSTLVENTRDFTKISNNNGVIFSSSPFIGEIERISKKNYSSLSSTSGDINNDFSFYLETLKEIVKEVDSDPIKTQQKLEESWLNILKEKLIVGDNIENVRSKLPSIFKKSKETLQIAAENGDLKRRFKNMGAELNNPDYLLLTLGYIISQYNYNKRNNIAMTIANNILYEIFKKNKKEFEDFKTFKLYYGYYNEKLGKDDITKLGRLGTYFMYLFMTEPTHIFEEKFETDEFFMDSDINLTVNSEYIELIRNEIMLHPKSIPMVCKPNPWGNNLYGGFLENQYIKDSVITGSTYHKHIMKNMDNLYNSINYLNSIKFSINGELLEYLNSNKGQTLISLLDTLKLKESNTEITKSEKLQRNITLKLAEIYRNFPFYLNTHADWRGRIYTHSFFISYQGGDLNSAVLQFWEGESLTESGLNYLYIYGANCYGKNGLDKKCFESRIDWVKENIDKIIQINPEFIASAESPYLFLAFSLALKNLQKDPKAIIKLPVFLDATCSGIQHLAALLADFNLGNNVNLVPSEKINDIYSTLLNPVNNAINKEGKENTEYSSLSEIKLTRKNIKRPIMTKVYNVSIIGIKDQLISDFKKVKIGVKTNRYEAPGKNGPVLVNNKEIFKIATIINNTIFDQFPSLKIIYDYFIEIVRIMLVLGIPLVWFTPSGLGITQSYSQSKIHKVSINIRGKSKKMVLRDWTDKVDKNKQVNAIIPNIIHSLDASHLINLINSAINNKFTPILTIHDCFGTHPNLMDKLSYEVKKEFILLYSNPNFLQLFHNRVIQSIKDNNFETREKDNSIYVIIKRKVKKLPDCPKIGKLELENIINSKYMIM